MLYLRLYWGNFIQQRRSFKFFISSLYPFHPALKYTLEISETSVAFLDINVLIKGNCLAISVHYISTNTVIYYFHLLTHRTGKTHGFRILKFLDWRWCACIDNSDFSDKLDEMLQFFKTRGFPDLSSSILADTTLNLWPTISTANVKEWEISTITFHPHNHVVKSIIFNLWRHCIFSAVLLLRSERLRLRSRKRVGHQFLSP